MKTEGHFRVLAPRCNTRDINSIFPTSIPFILFPSISLFHSPSYTLSLFLSHFTVSIFWALPGSLLVMSVSLRLLFLPPPSSPLSVFPYTLFPFCPIVLSYPLYIHTLFGMKKKSTIHGVRLCFCGVCVLGACVWPYVCGNLWLYNSGPGPVHCWNFNVFPLLL